MTNRYLPGKPAELVRGRWPFVLALLFALLPFGAGPQGAQEGSGLRQVVLVLLFVSAAFAIARFPGRLALLRQGIPITFAALLVYVMLSVGWSPDPWVSFKRAVQVVGVAVLGLGVLVGGNGQTRTYRLLPPMLLFFMATAVAFSAVFHDFAFADNGLRAFMATKNNFGQFALLCVLLPLYHVATGGRPRPLWIGLIVTGLVALVLSRSATSLLALAAVALVCGLVLAVRRLHASWWQMVLIVVMALLLAGFGLGVIYGFPTPREALSFILAPTGRDPTLAGRTYLWELMLGEAMHHPWFGLGYGGFWLGLQGESGQIAYLVKWGYPGQAHNGYLDLFNELGVVGCLLVLAFFVEHTRNLVRLSRSDFRLAMIHATTFVLILAINLAEAAVLRTTHMWWMILVASVFEVAYLTRVPKREPRLAGAGAGARVEVSA